MKRRLALLFLFLLIGAFVGLHLNAREAEQNETMSITPGTTVHSHNAPSCMPSSFHSGTYLFALRDSSKAIDSCGGVNERPTSINKTADNFETAAAIKQEHYNDAMNVLTVQFQAFDANNTARTIGGDEFRITFWAYEQSQTTTANTTTKASAFKTSVLATDLGNGSYVASFKAPKVFASSRLSLIHFYTCFDSCREGCVMTRVQRCFDVPVLPLHPLTFFGPIEVTALSGILPSSSNEFNETAFGILASLANSTTYCDDTQEGIDQVAKSGIWIDNNVVPGQELSQHANWIPLCCRPRDSTASNAPNVIRVGDSTLPYQTHQAGDVYKANAPHYGAWLLFLLNSTQAREAQPDDVIVFQAGLHYLMAGFRPRVAVDIVLHLLCQLTSVFPGKVLLLGPNPVQQHMYSQVDMRNGEARLMNAILRQRIVQEHHGSLLDICQSVYPSLATILLYSDDGGIATNQTRIRQQIPIRDLPFVQKAATMLGTTVQDFDDFFARMERLNYTSAFGTPTEHSFQQRMSHISNKRSYGNRTVWVTDIHAFLLSRDDTYRDHDKLHDLKGHFFWTKHSQLVDTLAQMRSQGPH